jgi:SAM-dependent methyltransferase
VIEAVLQSRPADRIAHRFDERRRRESQGERVVFQDLRQRGLFGSLDGARILEIGPKHGEDSRLLASLGPRELVLVERPVKHDLVAEWLPEVQTLCPTRLVEADLLDLDEAALGKLGQFDLVWCLGVLYHNDEPVGLLRRLYDLCRPAGQLVLETSLTRNLRLARKNVVEVHWPRTYRGGRVTHLPSRRAVESWLEIAGFRDVEPVDVYSWYTGWQRGVFLARRGRTDAGSAAELRAAMA